MLPYYILHCLSFTEPYHTPPLLYTTSWRYTLPSHYVAARYFTITSLRQLTTSLRNTFPSRNRTTLLHSKTIQFFTTPLHYFIALHSSFAIRGRSVHHSASPSLYYGNSLPHSAILLLHLTAHNFTWPSLDLNSPFFCIIMLNINLEH